MRILFFIFLFVVAVTAAGGVEGGTQSSTTDSASTEATTVKPSSSATQPPGTTTQNTNTDISTTTTKSPGSEGSTISTQSGTGTQTTGARTTTAPTTLPATTVAPTTEMPMSTMILPAITADNGRDVLINTLNLTNHVQQLINEMSQLEGDIDPNNSTLINQLTAMNVIANNMLDQLDSYQQQLKNQSTQMAQIQAKYDNVSMYYQCFATSSCVTEPPTTTIPTTTVPYNCSLGQDVFNATYNLQYLNASNVYSPGCSQTIESTNSTMSVDLNVTATITGIGYITIKNGYLGTTIQSIYNSVTNLPIKTQASSVLVTYGVSGIGSISFSIGYYQVGACDSVGCEHGSCYVNSLGQPLCNCTTFCYVSEGATCALQNTCGRAAIKACGTADNCATNATTCSYYCLHPVTTAASVALTQEQSWMERIAKWFN